MARTTVANVQAILDHNATISLTGFIDTATDLVTRVCDKSIYGYSSTTLELIERWLAAHFYVVRDKDVRATAENAGDAGQSMGDPKDLGLNATIYGQQAMTVDYQGALAALNKRITSGNPPKPGALWLGKCPDDREWCD